MVYFVGYYQSWNRYKRCTENDINPRLYTHLIYAFAGIEDNKIRVNDTWGDIEDDGFKKFNDLKKKNTSLKTLLAVGGWDEASESFSRMVKNSSSRKTFIDSCIHYAETYGFNGIDLDWEYPCQRGGNPDDKEKFSRLVAEMSTEFRKHNLLLSVAVAAGKDAIKESYDVPKLSRHVNFINLMTYDMHVASKDTKRTGHNAPLYSGCKHNVRTSVKAWIDAGAPQQKLVLGIPAYGRSYILDDNHKTYIGAPASKAGDPESVGYDQILKYEEEGYTIRRDPDQNVPYMYNLDHWIGYDDPKSAGKKVKFACNHELGGVMLYAVDTDNPRGDPKFPISKRIKEKIDKYF